MLTFADEFYFFIKNQLWVHQEDGKLFIKAEITPGGTGSTNVRDTLFDMWVFPIINGFPIGFQ